MKKQDNKNIVRGNRQGAQKLKKRLDFNAAFFKCALLYRLHSKM